MASLLDRKGRWRWRTHPRDEALSNQLSGLRFLLP
uniref:Uncharacterized protein n=1 Tax=Arundo donax TaxID=35708 RepID=A0A0A8YL91_ARUDO